ncbi:maestro heat-like repeat-containing protein family member 2B isoform X2 [Mauremys reevesii]|uniref:maestro heat-like repeat-containing protein family member 2B isoform X2 n=1 Tax=Mauremys reevesii TaxID=260615 RepID=UPI00193F1669|nr:maestro heat-like repeat-containing protein family member 2B isoform X2 [Mauremys reevesii]
MLLQFLRTSLGMIDDSAWSSQISLELNQQMASYTSPSREKSFLYKALGTSLAVCQDLGHVKSQLHQFLKATDYMEAPERQVRTLSLSPLYQVTPECFLWGSALSWPGTDAISLHILFIAVSLSPRCPWV